MVSIGLELLFFELDVSDTAGGVESAEVLAAFKMTGGCGDSNTKGATTSGRFATTTSGRFATTTSGRLGATALVVEEEEEVVGADGRVAVTLAGAGTAGCEDATGTGTATLARAGATVADTAGGAVAFLSEKIWTVRERHRARRAALLSKKMGASEPTNSSERLVVQGDAAPSPQRI
jgi:hypothetical protein